MTLQSPVDAQTAPPANVTEPAMNLYAIEIRVGAGWDSTKPPNEQAHFREHSANLKRLRDEGRLVLGARYSDKGLVVVRAASDQEAHAMMAEDPSIRARVFAYELHPFKVFYGGTVQPAPRRQ
jgi:uncharacterized protein YciI